MSEILAPIGTHKQDVNQYTNLATTNFKFQNNSTTNFKFDNNNKNKITNFKFENDNNNNSLITNNSLNNTTHHHQMTSFLSNKLFTSNLLTPNIFSRFALNNEHLSTFTNNINNLTNNINSTLTNNSINTQDNYDISAIKPITITPQTTTNNSSTTLTNLKPRTTPAREAVDPMKYISIEDQDGTKYACSKCGNVYKWRKSLNKHWKEKHEGEPLPTQEERERIIKFPSQNLQKNTNMKHFSNLNHKNVFIPNTISNIQKTPFHNNLINYGAFLKLETNQKPIQPNFQKNSNTMFQISKTTSPQAHQRHLKKDTTFDQHGVLDLSFKSSSPTKQEVPLDYSCKQSSGIGPMNTSALVKDALAVATRHGCMQCGALFESMEALNDHFVIKHIHQLPSISHTTCMQIGGSLKCEFKCCVCGQEEEWLCKLESHYDAVHAVISNNPYNLKNIRNKSHYANSLNPKHAATKQNSVESSSVDFTCSETMVVIPKAPEENCSSSDSRTSYKITDSQTTPFFQFSNTSDLNASKLNFSKSSQKSKKEGSVNGEVNLPYQCDLCDYKARWPSEMTQHKKNHSDEKPFLCPQCPYRSKWKWDVVKHLKRCGGNKEQTENQNKQRKVSPKFQEQIENKNVVLKGLPSYPHLTDNSTNGKSILQTIKLENGNANFFSFQSGQSGEIEDGIIKLENSQVLSSSDNNNFINNNNNYINHNSNNHPCEQCHFVGHSPAELRRHMRVHSSEKPFVCKSCQYSTKWKCDLKKHLKTYNHLAQDPHMMHAHPRRASDPSLRKHDNSDSDGYSVWEAEMSQDGYLKCKHCSFQATNLSSLVKHVKKLVCGVVVVDNEVGGDEGGCGGHVDKEMFLKKFGLMKRKSFEDSCNNSGNEESYDEKKNLNGNIGNHTDNNENITHNGFNTVDQNLSEKELNSLNSNKIMKYSDDPEHINNTLSTFHPKHLSGLMWCVFCGLRFENEDLMQEHVDLYHVIEQEFSGRKHSNSDSSEQTELVETDDYSTDKLLIDEDFLQIKNTKCLKINKKTPLGFFKCGKCRFTSRFQSNVDIHTKQHDKTSKSRCVSCGYSSFNAANVTKHKLKNSCRDFKFRKEREWIHRRRTITLYRKSDQRKF